MDNQAQGGRPPWHGERFRMPAFEIDLEGVSAQSWARIHEPRDWGDVLRHLNLEMGLAPVERSKGERRILCSSEVPVRRLSLADPKRSPQPRGSLTVSELPRSGRGLQVAVQQFLRSERARDPRNQAVVRAAVSAFSEARPNAGRDENAVSCLHALALRSMSELLGLWQIQVSVTAPGTVRAKQALLDRAVVVRIVPAGYWNFRPKNEREAQQCQAALAHAVEALAAQALEKLDAAVEAYEREVRYHIDDVLTALELAVPKASQSAFTGSFVGMDRAPQAYLESRDETTRHHCLVKEVRAISMTEEERVALLTPSVAMPRASVVQPAEEFLLVTGTPDCLMLDGSDRLHVVPSLYQEGGFIRDHGSTPEMFMERFGLTAEFVAKTSSYPVSQCKLYEHLLRKFKDSGPTHVLGMAHEMHRALLVLRHAGFRPAGLTLRVIADCATSVSYAELSGEGAPFDAFLENATSDLPTTLLGIRPEQLRVSRKLVSEHPDIVVWCERSRVALVHPSSGFQGGAHHVRNWMTDIASGNLSNGKDRMGGVPLEEATAWMRVHAFAMASMAQHLMDPNSGIRLFQGHSSSASKIDLQRFKGGVNRPSLDAIWKSKWLRKFG